MKHLKSFENIQNDPKVGDYIVILDMYNPIKLQNPDVIGEIEKIDNVEQTTDFENIKKGDIITFYKVVELNQKNNAELWLEKEEFDFFSSNMEEVKAFIDAKKYNL